ncbi:MAG: hypothetical protein AAFQ79_12970 [Pseudomonadota bacterium]
MSAPDTNIEKQKSRHRFVLIGFAVVGIFAAAMFLLNMGMAVDGEGPLVEEMVDDSAPVLQGEGAD